MSDDYVLSILAQARIAELRQLAREIHSAAKVEPARRDKTRDRAWYAWAARLPLLWYRQALRAAPLRASSPRLR